MSGGKSIELAGSGFDDFARARGPALVRLAFLMVRDHQLAEDLAQEGLARLHRHWAQGGRYDSPDAYVRKIMLNQLLSWRRRRSWMEQPTAEIPERPVAPHSATTEARAEMWSLLGTLPPRQRAVLVLRFYEDLDDSEIGLLLSCSPGTVRAHISKALARLRSAVEAAAEATASDLVTGGCHEQR